MTAAPNNAFEQLNRVLRNLQAPDRDFVLNTLLDNPELLPAISKIIEQKLSAQTAKDITLIVDAEKQLIIHTLTNSHETA